MICSYCGTEHPQNYEGLEQCRTVLYNKVQLQFDFVFSPEHDWVQVYYGNRLVFRGHSADARQILEESGFRVRTMHTTEEFAEAGSWPDNFLKFPHQHLRYGG